MSYFLKTKEEHWNISDAVKDKLKTMNSVEQALDSIRSDLDKRDEQKARDWKKKWKASTLTDDCNQKTCSQLLI